MAAFATRLWRNAMDVAGLQSFLLAGIARPVRILRSSGKMEIATLPPMLRRNPRSRIPRSIRSRPPRERHTEFEQQWSVVSFLMPDARSLIPDTFYLSLNQMECFDRYQESGIRHRLLTSLTTDH